MFEFMAGDDSDDASDIDLSHGSMTDPVQVQSS